MLFSFVFKYAALLCHGKCGGVCFGDASAATAAHMYMQLPRVLLQGRMLVDFILVLSND